MNKKILIPLIIIAVFLSILLISILQYRSQGSSFLQTIPLLSLPTPTPTATPTTVPLRAAAGIPVQTNIQEAIKGVDSTVSLIEKNKVFDALPIRVENFQTSQNIKSTINIYNLTSDPNSTIRIEIYNINYNNSELNGPDALAFKDSFTEVKRLLAPYQVRLKQLQIIYGNRQYIQDIATFWVKSFNLL